MEDADNPTTGSAVLTTVMGRPEASTELVSETKLLKGELCAEIELPEFSSGAGVVTAEELKTPVCTPGPDMSIVDNALDVPMT